MKFARIIDDRAVDVIDADPADIFHPDLAAEFVEVPDEVEPGSVLVDGEWVAPEPPPPPPAPLAEPVRRSLPDFLRLFTLTELAAFNALRKRIAVELATPDDYADPDKAILVGFEVFLTHYDALRNGLIELDHPDTAAGLNLLVPLGVLTAPRLASVLAGEAPQ